MVSVVEDTEPRKHAVTEDTESLDNVVKVNIEPRESAEADMELLENADAVNMVLMQLEGTVGVEARLQPGEK